MPSELSLEDAKSQYTYVTDGYVKEIRDRDPIKKAKNLAKAYQKAYLMYSRLDQDKVKLWKAIQHRISRTYRDIWALNTNPRSAQSFDIATLRDIMEVEPLVTDQRDYRANPDQPGEPYEWFWDLGLKREGVKFTVLNQLFDPLKNMNQSKIGETAEVVKEMTVEGWPGDSKFIEFGRKVEVLETAVDVFAEELRMYVLYGGGRIHSIDAVDGITRDYQSIRVMLAKDVAEGRLSVDSDGYVNGPPPSPFIAAIMNERYPDQVETVNTITTLLSKSQQGKEFLFRTVEMRPPWEIDPRVKPADSFFFDDDGDPIDNPKWEPDGILGGAGQADWIKGNVQAVKDVEGNLRRHMGFNLLALLDDPHRTHNGSSTTYAAPKGQSKTPLQWWRWTGSKFHKPSSSHPGTVFRYQNRRGSGAFNSGSWVVGVRKKAGSDVTHPTAEALAEIAARTATAGTYMAGWNMSYQGKGAPPPTLDGVTFDGTAPKQNVATILGVAVSPLIGVTNKIVGAGYSNYVDFMDAKYFDGASDYSDEFSDSYKRRFKAVHPKLAGALSAVSAAMLIYKGFERNDGLSPKDYATFGVNTVNLLQLLNDSNENWVAEKAQNFLDGSLRFGNEAMKGIVDLAFEGFGLVFDTIDAVITGMTAAHAYEVGNFSRSYILWTVTGLTTISAITGVLAAWSTSTFVTGTLSGQFYLYIISAVASALTFITTVVGWYIVEDWTLLEEWLAQTYFGRNYKETTGINTSYYGFSGDFLRQVSHMQGIQSGITVDDCYIDHGELTLTLSGMNGLSERSELLVCGLLRKPKSLGKQLFPLLVLPLHEDRYSGGNPLQNRTMPTGLEFGGQKPMQIQSVNGASESDNTFSLQTTNQIGPTTDGDPQRLVENYLVAPVNAHEGHWGYELLYFPTGLPERFVQNLQGTFTKNNRRAKAMRERLFSMAVPRIRVRLVWHRMASLRSTEVFPSL